MEKNRYLMDYHLVLQKDNVPELSSVNGTGKSTLLKIIAGAEIPDTGDMTHSRGYTISYLSQQPEFDEQLTVLEQVFHGDTPLIRLLRDYEKALLHIEKDPK